MGVSIRLPGEEFVSLGPMALGTGLFIVGVATGFLASGEEEDAESGGLNGLLALLPS